MPKPPSYQWACHRCGATNAPGLDVCRACGFPAVASANEIGKTNAPAPQQFCRLGSEPIGEEARRLPHTDADGEANGGSSVLLIVFGAYLMAGSYSSIVNKHWPIFMPPQLDLVALVAGGWDSVSAAYIAGGITGVLGVLCFVLGIPGFRSKA